MSDSKAAQAARNAADRRLREANPVGYRKIMQEEFAKRGLTWTPRPSKEERERREAEQKQTKARARIEAEAKKAGLQVSFHDEHDSADEEAAAEVENVDYRH